MNSTSGISPATTAIDAPQDLLIVLRHAPHGSSWLREGLDVALVAAAFGKRVGLLFQGDGVFALLQGQSSGPLAQKGTHPQLAMLEMYDIEHLWVSEAALAARGLSVDSLMLPVTSLGASRIARLMHSHPHTLIF